MQSETSFWHSYRYKHFFGLLQYRYSRPAKLLQQFDSRGVVHGGGWMRPEQGRESISVGQRRRWCTVAELRISHILIFPLYRGTWNVAMKYEICVNATREWEKETGEYSPPPSSTSSPPRRPWCIPCCTRPTALIYRVESIVSCTSRMRRGQARTEM